MSTPDDYEFYLEEPMPEGEFYQWVGRCIKEWAGAEDILFDICHRIIGAKRQIVAIIYYRTPTIDARLTLADDLVQAALPRRERQSGGHDHPHVARWKQLVKDIRALLPVRNLLAHSRVGRVRSSTSFEGVEGVEDLTTRWFEIATALEEQLRGRPEIVIRDKELPGYLGQVQSTLSRLAKFNRLLEGTYRKKVPPEGPFRHTTPRRSAQER